MSDMQPDPDAPPAVRDDTSEENWVAGAAVPEMPVRRSLGPLVLLALAILVVGLGGAVVATALQHGVSPGGMAVAAFTPTALVSATPSPPMAPTPGAKTWIEDVLVGGGCKISPACPAAGGAGETVTHGIQISAGSPAVLALDRHFTVIRFALYTDHASTTGYIFRATDVSDPSFPVQQGAFQINLPVEQGDAMPIHPDVQRLSLGVDSGTVDVVGYVAAS